MIITLDGQSGTGKSTLALLLANKLHFLCLNTGMLYRAVTAYLLEENISYNSEKLEKTMSNLKVEIKFINHAQNVFVCGKNYTNEVSSRPVQENVALYSAVKCVRKRIVALQKDFAAKNNIVVEGRDLGTAVFPDANYKFFVTCDVNVRSQRRLDDLKKMGQSISFEEVKNSLLERDLLDSTREINPLKRPDDAIDIDTSHKTIDQSIEEILSYIKLP